MEGSEGKDKAAYLFQGLRHQAGSGSPGRLEDLGLSHKTGFGLGKETTTQVTEGKEVFALLSIWNLEKRLSSSTRGSG